MYSNITSCLRFLPMDLSGSFDGENSWENRSKKKKNAVTRFKRNTENYPRKCFWVYPADIAIHLLNNWGTDTSVSRLNVTNATRDVQRVPVSRLPRAPQQPRHCYATLRVSPSRAPVLSFSHYFQAPATQATLLWSDLKRQLQANG